MAYSLDWMNGCASRIDERRENVTIDNPSSIGGPEADGVASVRTVNCVYIDDVQSLNYLISECREVAKGRLFFRGQPSLYGELPLAGGYRTGQFKLAPIVDRFVSKLRKSEVDEVLLDELLQDSSAVADLDNGRGCLPYYALEGVLQQYGGDTRWLDVVDNIQIALWMATRVYGPTDESFSYVNSAHPILSVKNVFAESVDRRRKVFVYFIAVKGERLMMDESKDVPLTGLTETDDFVLLDLRQALPARFLRPHSQHASLLKWGSVHSVPPSLLAIASIPAEFALSLVEGSDLFSSGSIFPDPEVDFGFSDLCSFANMNFGDRAAPERMLPIESRFQIYR